MPEDALFF